MRYNEDLHNPLLEEVSNRTEKSLLPDKEARGRRPIFGLLILCGALSLAAFLASSCCSKNHQPVLSGHHTHHGHVFYQATLKPNNQIEYAREFTAPCDHGILVFNVGPAADYLPYMYDIYQDAYVFSNNKKMCWAYPTYRGIQKGPFPWWVQGDPTSFDVLTGLTPTKISHRIVRPIGARNISAHKGGDYLIMAHHKFYTPTFYENLKNTVNSWTDDDDNNDEGALFDALFDMALSVEYKDDDEELPISQDFQVEASY